MSGDARSISIAIRNKAIVNTYIQQIERLALYWALPKGPKLHFKKCKVFLSLCDDC